MTQFRYRTRQKAFTALLTSLPVSLLTDLRTGLLISLLACLASCGDAPCESAAATQLVTLRFLRDRPRGDTALVVDRVRATGADSVFYRRDNVRAGITSVVVTLNPAADATTVLVQRATRTDSVRFTYQRTFALQSPDCAPKISFTGVQLDTTLRSFRLPRPPSQTAPNNVEIYF